MDYGLDDEIVVFDIETTGFNFRTDMIIEIGGVKVKEGKVTDKFNVLINPGIEIPPKIVELTGITTDMVTNAPLIEKALNDFLEFVGDLPLVAHNSNFDMGFIKFNAKKFDKKVDNMVIDTLQF